MSVLGGCLKRKKKYSHHLFAVTFKTQKASSEWKVAPTDNTPAEQTRILSKCPWTELRTPACSVAASHSEFERQLNSLNANAYHFPLKSDSAKMTKLHWTLLWQYFLQPIIYVFMTRSCWNGLFSPRKRWISTWHSFFFLKAAAISVWVIGYILIISLDESFYFYFSARRCFAVKTSCKTSNCSAPSNLKRVRYITHAECRVEWFSLSEDCLPGLLQCIPSPSITF